MEGLWNEYELPESIERDIFKMTGAEKNSIKEKEGGKSQMKRVGGR